MGRGGTQPFHHVPPVRTLPAPIEAVSSFFIFSLAVAAENSEKNSNRKIIGGLAKLPNHATPVKPGVRDVLNPLGRFPAACREFVIPAEAGIPPMAGLDSVSKHGMTARNKTTPHCLRRGSPLAFSRGSHGFHFIGPISANSAASVRNNFWIISKLLRK